MNASIRIDIVWLFSLGLALIVGWFVASGLWLGAVAAIAGIAVVLAAIRWPGMVPVIWVLGTPTLFVMVDNALMGVPLFTVERALYVLSATLFIARFLLKPGTMEKPIGVDKAMALYVLVMAVSWVTHLSDKTGTDVKNDIVLLLEAFLMPFSAYMMARNLNWSDRVTDRFLWALAFGVGGYLVAVGLLQYWLHWDFFLSIRSVNEHPDRVTGPFTNALEYGTVLMLVLLVAIYLFLRCRKALLRVALLMLMGGMVLGLVLSKGRAVWLSAPLALGMVFWRVPNARRFLLSAAAGLVVLTVLVGPVVTDPSALSRRLDSPEEYYNRMALWGTAGNMIAHAPLFGHGFGAETFLHNKARYYHSFNGVSAVWAAWPSVPHNELLNNAVMAGVFGLGACLLLWLRVWRTLGQAVTGRFPTPGRELAPFVQAGFLVVIINALFLDMMFLVYVPLLFYFLAGLALRPGLEHGSPGAR
jgi:O-antigen ligase